MTDLELLQIFLYQNVQCPLDLIVRENAINQSRINVWLFVAIRLQMILYLVHIVHI